MSAVPERPPSEPLSAWDLRLRSLVRKRGEPISLCSECDDVASWSVWLHTPEWPENGGLTRVLCGPHAINILAYEAALADDAAPIANAPTPESAS